MHDLASVDRLDDLAGPACAGLKIEGRLKNAAWVARPSGSTAALLDGERRPRPLLEEAGDSAPTPAGTMTCGYLDGQRDELTGMAGRDAAAED